MWVPVDAEIISHASHSECWRQIWEFLGRPPYMLMPSFFLDEWRPYTQRSVALTGIYMYLTNVLTVSDISILLYYIPEMNHEHYTE